MQNVFFIRSFNKAGLSHKRSAFDGMSRDSCRIQGHDKRDNM